MAVEVDVQLGKSGRVVIPANIRRKYELHDGDWVRLVVITESDNVCKDAIIQRAMEDKKSWEV